MYLYVGPEDIRATALGQSTGTTIGSLEQLVAWITDASVADQPVTFVVGLDGDLVVAPRESEHVAAAAGRPVLAAGEMTFDRSGAVLEVSNQSTGYCPEPQSWSAVEASLDALGVSHPDAYTTAFVFRRCQACGSINLVKDDDFVCAVCGSSDKLLSRQAPAGAT